MGVRGARKPSRLPLVVGTWVLSYKSEAPGSYPEELSAILRGPILFSPTLRRLAVVEELRDIAA